MSKSRPLTFALCTVALFAACAVPLGNYTKAGVTQEQLARDSYECVARHALLTAAREIALVDW